MQFGYQELGWDKKYRLRLASAAPSTCAEDGAVAGAMALAFISLLRGAARRSCA